MMRERRIDALKDSLKKHINLQRDSMMSKIFWNYSLFPHVNEPDDEFSCSIRRNISILKKKKVF